VNFAENFLNERGGVTGGWGGGGQTEMTKLMVAFHNFPKAFQTNRRVKQKERKKTQ